ncbi:hypothetical protein RI129_000109 [Pyrocoelia pectoralis]|uniref:Enoyl reductase (ER) domain-containing protein n=1 Tax=Pyrocoelia pectoralis TaxID=417401 RepID=A0AAN7ZBF9_9COLE
MSTSALKRSMSTGRLSSLNRALYVAPTAVPLSAASVQKRELSHRSWNLVRYHEDLNQAIKYTPNASAPVLHRPGDVLVRVLASSINPLDIAMTRGYGNVLLSLNNLVSSIGIDRLSNDRLPLTLGRDFVGQIVSRGNSVKLYKPGDIVWGTVQPHENGSHADFVAVPDCQVRILFQFLFCEYVSNSYFSLFFLHNNRVLVLGGSGGVGCFAIQLLKFWGAHVTATCSQEAMPWLAENCHPDRCVDYEDMEGFLASTTDRFDFILDASAPAASRKNYELLTRLTERNRRSLPVGAKKSPTRLMDDKTMYVTLSSPLLRNFDRYGALGGAATTLADAITDSLSGARNGLHFRWAYYLPNPKALAHIGDLVERAFGLLIGGREGFCERESAFEVSFSCESRAN